MSQHLISPCLSIGEVVTIPENHGRESGMIGRISAIEQTEFGVMYQVKVPTSLCERSVPVLAQLLDHLEASERGLLSVNDESRPGLSSVQLD